MANLIQYQKDQIEYLITIVDQVPESPDCGT